VLRVYDDASGFRPGPRVMARAQTRGDRVVLFVIDLFLAPSERAMGNRLRPSLELSLIVEVPLRVLVHTADILENHGGRRGEGYDNGGTSSEGCGRARGVCG
jgi:hypothetical protein